MDEARLQHTETGLAAISDGWFVVNVREAAWMHNERFGAACIFEDAAAMFAQVGYTIAVLEPGQPNGLYHHEGDQEDFLILSGECLALVEGEERPMRAWDFLHCPDGTDHIFVGTGKGPCVIFMAGGRAHRGSAEYPRSQLALRHGAGSESDMGSSDDPYAPFPKWRPGPGPGGVPL